MQELVHAQQRAFQGKDEELAELMKQLSELQESLMEAKLPAASERLKALRIELEAQREALRTDSSEWEADRSQTAEQPHRPSTEPLSGKQEADDDSHHAEEPEEVTFQQPDVEAPTSASDVLERFRHLASLEEQDEDESDAASGVASPFPASADPPSELQSPSPGRDVPAGRGQDGDENEESIDEYMAKLLQRMRGKETPAAPKPLQPQPPRRPAVEAQDSPAAAVSTPQPSTEPAGESFELAPRSMTRELPNLAAMRELANSSTREAIDASVRRGWVQDAAGKLAVSMIIFAGGGYLFTLADFGDILFIAASLLLLIGLFWSGQSIALLRKLARTKVEKSGDGKDKAAPEARSVSEGE